MADVVRAVNRLLQRAQHHRLQELRVRPVLDAREQLRVVARVRIISPAQLQSKTLQKLAQRREFLRCRAFVDAVEHRVIVAAQEVRSADIGGEHAFLDQPVGIVALDRHDALDLAVLVEDHLGLDGLEVDRAAPLARLREQPVEPVQVLHVRQQGVVAARRLAPLVLQHRRDLGIGEPRVRAEHRGDRTCRTGYRRLRRSAYRRPPRGAATFGLSEHSPFESFSGSIGITRRGK